MEMAVKLERHTPEVGLELIWLTTKRITTLQVIKTLGPTPPEDSQPRNVVREWEEFEKEVPTGDDERVGLHDFDRTHSLAGLCTPQITAICGCSLNLTFGWRVSENSRLWCGEPLSLNMGVRLRVFSNSAIFEAI
jgi:hypothetical protein